ncbi:hypothetical protein AAX22_01045 [Oenococcus oeni]|nr:hypothetical protein AAX22_01045 [Oenococcus oeni]
MIRLIKIKAKINSSLFFVLWVFKKAIKAGKNVTTIIARIISVKCSLTKVILPKKNPHQTAIVDQEKVPIKEYLRKREYGKPDPAATKGAKVLMIGM